MDWDDVRNEAKSLLDYTGGDAKLNSRASAVKTRILTAHPWEQFMKEGTLAYTASSDTINLTTNANKEVYRMVAMRLQNENIDPPEYVTPGEYNRLYAGNWDANTTMAYWTQIGRNINVLGKPSSNKTLEITYMRDPKQVNWGEIDEDFLDLAAIVLARKVTSLRATLTDGAVSVDPVAMVLVTLEKDAIKTLVDLEYRRPGRDYKVREDDLWTVRREQYDY